MDTEQSPKISINVALNQLPIETIETLVCQMFADQAHVHEVTVTELRDSSIGMSQISLLLAIPQGADGVQHNPIALRIGLTPAILREQENFEHYVEPYLGFETVHLKYKAVYAAGTPYAALGYEYLQRSSESIQTLRSILTYEREHQATINALKLLFTDTIANPERPHNGWCGNSERYAAQRPLWFYNLVLPPTLTLREVEPTAEALPAETVLAMLARADQADSHTLNGTPLAFASNAAYRVSIAPEEPEEDAAGLIKLRCLLRESQAPPQGIKRPFDPIIARIELRVTPANLAAVQTALQDGTALMGTVAETRYQFLHELVLRHDLRSAQLTAQGSIALVDPLASYAKYLQGPANLHTCIIHGDLNLGNILMRRQRSGAEQTQMLAWLIDFDRTMAGGHAVYDFVKLETEYKCQILPFKLRQPHDILRLEEALYRAIFNPDAVHEILGDNIELVLAYDFLSTLRRLAMISLPAPRPSPHEYYLGLLLTSLATLKYRNLYGDQRERWLQPEAAIEPLARVAYLTASFAATVIDRVATLHLKAESYPILPYARLPERPQLLGRDLLVGQIERLFNAQRHVAVIYGSAGSGRDSVATAVAVGLERTGYVPLTNLIEATGMTPVNSESVLDHLLAALELHQVANLPARANFAATPDPARRRARLSSAINQLAAALANDKQRFIIKIALQRGDQELEELTIQLAQRLTHGVLLLTADQPLASLSSEVQFKVEPLNAKAVRDYSERKQLKLDATAQTKLLTLTGGLPGLLIPLLNQLGDMQTRSSWDDLLAKLPLDTTRDHFAQDLLQQQQPTNRILAELDACLQHYGYVEAHDLEVLAVRSQRIMAQQADSVLQHYTQTLAPIQPIIGETALAQFTRRDYYRAFALEAAAYYAQHPTRPRHLEARYALLGGDWEWAERVVQHLIATPDRAYQLPRAYLLNLLEELLKSQQLRKPGAILALTGDIAAFLSNYTLAETYYQRALFELPPDAEATQRILGQLLRIYQARGDQNAANSVAEELYSVAPESSPLHSLALAHQGHSALMSGNLPLAGSTFARAIEQLQASRSTWGKEHDYYQEHLIRLTDMLARVEAMLGRSDHAIHLIGSIRTAATELHDRALIAMLDSNRAAFHTMRGRFRDPILARQIFSHVLVERRDLGDWIGTIRTGQNLALLTTELATAQSDWDTAEAIYAEAEVLVEQVQDYDAIQIYANHLELLNRQGDTKRAQSYAERIVSKAAYQQGRSQLNIARTQLLDGKRNEANRILIDLAALLGHSGADTEQRREWACLCLELHLRFGYDYDAAALASALQAPEAEPLAPLDEARLRFGQGLWACTHGDLSNAADHLARAEQLWQQVGYHYLATSAVVWQGFAAQRAGDLAVAQQDYERAIERLIPFDNPPLRRLAQTWLAGDQEPPV
ncbi:hypothetical protein [Candidatus Viridilinea mediisalina]|uniref:Ternary complex associated domain-containing protein n=1 Tax=Candidatus Viridilinea mediisalina TaxID=2024553 RepID=A0A2A6RH31_9CHLR|nr:hypothetical protein [Candidatus Viridilinea mediisalina]PDW02243.1 hypothetical protein CJ255_14995 [Candidatus Viridilinea mediisalina]